MIQTRKQLVDTMLALPDAELVGVLGELSHSGRAGLAPRLPSWDAMAKLVALDDFRIGRHYLRDDNGERVASLEVRRWWGVEVRARHQAPWRLACVAVAGEAHLGRHTEDWTKAVLATREGCAVLALQDDRVAEAIAAIDLRNLDQRHIDAASRHSVDHRVTLETASVRASFEFISAVEGSSLAALEREIATLAALVAVSSGNPALMANAATT